MMIAVGVALILFGLWWAAAKAWPYTQTTIDMARAERAVKPEILEQDYTIRPLSGPPVRP